MDLDAVLYLPITHERAQAILEDGQPLRICFRTTHAHEPKQSQPPYVGTINVPFFQTISPVFESDLGLKAISEPEQAGLVAVHKDTGRVRQDRRLGERAGQPGVPA
jgi:hypothetical protein